MKKKASIYKRNQRRQEKHTQHIVNVNSKPEKDQFKERIGSFHLGKWLKNLSVKYQCIKSNVLTPLNWENSPK